MLGEKTSSFFHYELMVLGFVPRDTSHNGPFNLLMSTIWSVACCHSFLILAVPSTPLFCLFFSPFQLFVATEIPFCWNNHCSQWIRPSPARMTQSLLSASSRMNSQMLLVGSFLWVLSLSSRLTKSSRRLHLPSSEVKIPVHSTHPKGNTEATMVSDNERLYKRMRTCVCACVCAYMRVHAYVFGVTEVGVLRLFSST